MRRGNSGMCCRRRKNDTKIVFIHGIDGDLASKPLHDKLILLVVSQDLGAPI